MNTIFGFSELPILHEIAHLIAIPSKAFHKDTTVFFRMDGLRSNMSIRLGGRITRNKQIWVALFPFMLLTILPFSLLLAGFELDFFIGVVAAGNFGASVQDIGQAIAYAIRLPNREIAQE